MSIDACAGLVQRGDPDRFAAVMAAPRAMRGRLFVIYAFNLEVARAPWVTTEPMIAEMRLQWWRDVLTGPRRAHEVAGPLHDLIAQQDLPVDVMDRLIAARRWEILRDAHADQAALDAYLEDTGAGLMWLAARASGAPPQIEPVARDVGWAAGLAAYLRAVPELEARGRVPLVDGRSDAVRALAERGLARLAMARKGARGGAALLAGWQAARLLRQVTRDPSVVADGRMGLSEFARRGGLIWQAVTGRF
jgi:15-cis-phytoene synthase